MIKMTFLFNWFYKSRVDLCAHIFGVITQVRCGPQIYDLYLKDVASSQTNRQLSNSRFNTTIR